MTAPRIELTSQRQKVSRLPTEPPGRPACTDSQYAHERYMLKMPFTRHGDRVSAQYFTKLGSGKKKKKKKNVKISFLFIHTHTPEKKEIKSNRC